MIRITVFWLVFLFSALATCDGLLNLYLINTEIGYNGLGAGGILIATFGLGNLAFALGGWKVAKSFYDKAVARLLFVVSLPTIFSILIMGANFIDERTHNSGAGMPSMAFVFVFALVTYLWLTLEITRKI